MCSVVARKGRHRQRYENNLRLVSGCIPYRLLTKDARGYCTCGNLHETWFQVLMVTSPNRDDLVFPKGGWEDDETREEAACREAQEEAGVIGIIKEAPLGEWEFRSKSKQNSCSLEGGCKGYMFALEVTEVLETWPEHQNRGRRWLNIKEAFELCRYEWMREALEAFLRVMADERKLDLMEDKMEEAPVARLPPVSSVGGAAECQVISCANCSVKPTSSTTHQPGIHHISPFTWHSVVAADMSL